MKARKSVITQATKGKYRRATRFAVNALLLVFASSLFALSHPNPISVKGFPLVAYFAFVPLFILARRVSFLASPLWGAAYGALCYCAYSYWLKSFHPLALYTIIAIYLLWMSAILPILRLACTLFPRRGYVLQWLIWLGYEYAKTLGFAGFSYGIIGYSQWRWLAVIQIAAIFGVWGVSALVVFPSAWIAAAIKSSLEAKNSRPSSAFSVSAFAQSFKRFAMQERVPALCYFAFLVFTVTFSLFSIKDWSNYSQVKVALIQHNSDPWVGNIQTYRKEFAKLSRLSNEALAAEPSTAFVVWPETAFIPRIEWHYKYREDRESLNLVLDLLRYLENAPVPFVIGNDDAIRITGAEGTQKRIDYNSALLFYPGKNVLPPAPKRYRKTHLVPFTEHFPYRKAFPWVYNLLVANDTHFWEKGNEYAVFKIGDLRFSTPICFEDTFGYISRQFVNKGARAIVNLTNDAWAKDSCCQYQHLAMSVFRAVENRVPLVRATASGQTAAVNPNGKVVAMLSPFSESWLIADIPLVPQEQRTLYGLWGDLWGNLFLFSSMFFLAAGFIFLLKKRTKKSRLKE